jgi:hypothetical protein
MVPRSRRRRGGLATSAVAMLSCLPSAHAQAQGYQPSKAFLKVLLAQPAMATPSQLLQAQTVKTATLNQLENSPQTPAVVLRINTLEAQLANIEQRSAIQMAILAQKSVKLENQLAALESIQPSSPKQAIKLVAEETRIRGSLWATNYQSRVYERVSGTPTR